MFAPWLLAEGEELGSNVLRVGQRSLANSSVMAERDKLYSNILCLPVLGNRSSAGGLASLGSNPPALTMQSAANQSPQPNSLLREINREFCKSGPILKNFP
jgi:hypothetical protein